MRVFISWSGKRSQIVAETLREWLVRVIQRLEPWVSTEDIRAGARWQSDISGILASTKVGILCLAPESLDSRWLNFEAGALAKTIDDSTLVCPYLIGMDPGDVPPPIGLFQSKRADYEGTRSLLRTINDALGESALSDEQLSDSFEMYWPRLKSALDQLPPPDMHLAQKRDSTEVLDEILSIVRGLARNRSSVSRGSPAFVGAGDIIRGLTRPLDKELLLVVPCEPRQGSGLDYFEDLRKRLTSMHLDATNEENEEAKESDQGE